MKEKFVVTPFQKKSLAITTAIAVIFGAYFLWGYFLLIVLAAIIAFMFNPLYQRLLKKWGKPGTAATLSLIASFLTLIIPLMLLLVVTANELKQLADGISQVSLNGLESEFIAKFNQIMQDIGVSFRLTEEGVTAAATEFVQKFGSEFLKDVAGAASSFFSMFSTAIIYIFVFLSLLLNQDKIFALMHRLNPLGKSIGELYLNRVSAMTKAMVKGQFIIAFLQGLTDAALLYFAGLQDLFFFFVILLTALSVIPLGGGIIAIPIGIIMILTGDVWQGLLVIGGHLLIVTNIDNVLRPRLVPKQARLDSALTLLAVFSGLHFFGFLGIVIGPVIMILIVTTIQVYEEVFHDLDAVNRDKDDPKNKKSFIKKLAFWHKQPKKLEE